MKRDEFIAHLLLRGFKQQTSIKWRISYPVKHISYIQTTFIPPKIHVRGRRVWGYVRKTGASSSIYYVFRQHDQALQFINTLYEETDT